MSIDWASLGLVTVVTVFGTSFILAITSSAARMPASSARPDRSGGCVPPSWRPASSWRWPWASSSSACGS